MEITFLEQVNIALANIATIIGDVLLHGILWFFPFAFLGFIIAILMAYFFNKTKILVRKRRVWNVLAKLFYLALLLVLPVSIGSIGTTLQIQRLTHNMLDDELMPAISNKMPAFNDYMVEQAGRLKSDKMVSVKDLLDPVLQDLYYTPQSDNLFEIMKGRFINEVILQTIASAATEGVQAILITQIEFLGSALADKDFTGRPQGEFVKLGVGIVTKFTTDIAKELDYTQVNASLPRVIVNAVKAAIDGYFKIIYIMIFLSIFLLFGFIGVEIYFYRRYLRKLALVDEV